MTTTTFKRAFRYFLAPALAVGLMAPMARADWSVDLLGPHGRVSFGDRDYPEYGGVDTYGDYDDALDGYGHWEYVGGYGRCWVPYVATTWRPYYYGSWVWTSYGWNWSSYEPWGYIPHHYGDWRYVGNYGWCWSPGYTWSPANVNWYYRDGYMGWGPRGVDIDININFINFVNVRNFSSDRVYDHILASSALPMQFTQNIHGLAVRPPAPAFISKKTGQRINQIPLVSRNLRVGNHDLKMLAPAGHVKERVLSNNAPVVQKSGTPVRPAPHARPAPGPSHEVVPHGKPSRPMPAPEPRVTKPSRPSHEIVPHGKPSRPMPAPEPRVTKPSRPSHEIEPNGKPSRPMPAPAPQVIKPSRPSHEIEPNGKPSRPSPAPSPHVTKPSRPSPAPSPHVTKPSRPSPAPSPHVTKPSRPSPAPSPHVTKPSRPSPEQPSKPAPSPKTGKSKPSTDEKSKPSTDDDKPIKKGLSRT